MAGCAMLRCHDERRAARHGAVLGVRRLSAGNACLRCLCGRTAVAHCAAPRATPPNTVMCTHNLEYGEPLCSACLWGRGMNAGGC